MRALYPAIEPFAREHLVVDELHTLYLEQSGKPEGIPVLFLHGGPVARVPDAARASGDSLTRIEATDYPERRTGGQRTWDCRCAGHSNRPIRDRTRHARKPALKRPDARGHFLSFLK
ncbi:MAG: hypothetical protein ACRERV_04450 [Methylococcales bacterium]